MGIYEEVSELLKARGLTNKEVLALAQELQTEAMLSILMEALYESQGQKEVRVGEGRADSPPETS